MFTIEDLSKGRCAVINDGTLEQLHEVLKLAFPSASKPAGTYKFYYTDKSGSYSSCTPALVPRQSVKDFLTTELKRGDLVWVSDNDPNERNTKAIFITKADGANYPYITVASSAKDEYYAGKTFATGEYLYATKVEEPKEVCMTVEDIEKALGVTNLKIVK